MKYYLLSTDSFPYEFADGESVILVQNEESNTEIDENNLAFITTFVVNATEDERAIEEFSTWWQENTTGQFQLELMTEEILHLNSERQAFVNNLESGAWSLKDSFIAYSKGDVASRNYAKEIVMESEFQVQ